MVFLVYGGILLFFILLFSAFGRQDKRQRDLVWGSFAKDHELSYVDNHVAGVLEGVPLTVVITGRNRVAVMAVRCSIEGAVPNGFELPGSPTAVLSPAARELLAEYTTRNDLRIANGVLELSCAAGNNNYRGSFDAFVGEAVSLAKKLRATAPPPAAAAPVAEGVAPVDASVSGPQADGVKATRVRE